MTSPAHAWDRLKRSCRQRWQEPDKHQHFWASALLTLAALWLYPPAIAYSAVWLVGLAKEVWDHFYGSGFCRIDMLANGLGIASAALGFQLVTG